MVRTLNARKPLKYALLHNPFTCDYRYFFFVSGVPLIEGTIPGLGDKYQDG